MKIRATLWLMLGAVFLWAGCTTEESTGPGGSFGSGTPISGTLTADITIAQSPYWVKGNLVIPENTSVRIDAGVEIRFDPDNLYAIYVYGQLEALGTADNNIKFTSMQGALGAGDFGQWRAIVFDTKNQATSKLEYCLIEFGASSDTTAKYPIYPASLWNQRSDSLLVLDSLYNTQKKLTTAIMIWNCSPVINHCTIVKNGYNGIWCIGTDAHPLITNNNIYENDGDGIRCTDDQDQYGQATPEIRYNNCKENNSQQFADVLGNIGKWTDVNANRDSCDFQFNISLDPDFANFNEQDYTLLSCSHCINAADDGSAIGSIPYTPTANELRGPIGNRTLTGGNYRVTCDAFVEHGDSFILSNTTLIFEGFYHLYIVGTFQADNVTFMPLDSVSTWNGIILTEDASANSYVRNCTFLNASTTLTDAPYGGALTIQGISPQIYNNTFTGSEYTAISLQDGAQPEISYNSIIGFGPAAIYCYNNCRPYLHHNRIASGLGYGIWCNFLSSPRIESSLIYDTSLIGIKCENQSDPEINYNTIVNHDYNGVDCSDNSNPLIQNNIIAFNGSPLKYNTDYGNGVNEESSSLPELTNNYVYQPAGQGSPFSSGLNPDASNIINVDPQFDLTDTTRPYYLLQASPCNNTPQGKIGAYGLGDWNP